MRRHQRRAGAASLAGESAAATSDELLMAAVRGGDLDPLAVLFERHARRLFGLLYGLVGSAAAAEDLVQETFLRVLRHRRSYRPSRAFLPWLLSIARNVAWTYLARRARMPRGELRDPTEPGCPEQQQLERERADRLARALEQLPDADREVLLLTYFEDLRYAQIAQVVGASAGAVKVRAHRARRNLRARLTSTEEEPS